MKKYTLLLCASTSLLTLGNPAIAASSLDSELNLADAPETDSDAVSSDVIIVTARRREEGVQDVPQTVNVVTAAQVEKLNLRNFQDIQSVVPGLTLTSTSAFSNQATVRGVAFVPEASGNNPSVEFYMNDAPIASGFLFQSTFDFGQFELQRGPQGTLRGRASPSGSIAVTMRRPDLNEVGLVVNGTITDNHARKLDGAFNIPIIADVLAVRLAGAIDDNRSNLVRSIKEISDPSHNEAPFRRTEAIRGSIRFDPTDWAAFNVMYQSLHADGHSFNQVASDSLFTGAVATTPIFMPFDRLSFDDQGGYDRQDQKVLIGNADIRFAGQKLSYVGSYSKQDFGSLAMQDAGDFFAPPRVPLLGRNFADPVNFEPVCGNEQVVTGITPTTNAPYQCTHGTSTRRSHELRLASEDRIGGIFDYVAGVFYDQNTPISRLTQETALVNLTTGSVNFSRTAILRDARSTEKSAFGNLTAHLFDNKLELSGGLRYIDYEEQGSLRQSSTASATTAPCGPANLGNCVTLSSTRSHSNATVYLASAKYQITPDIMVYALTGSSWRPGPRVIGNFSVGPTGVEGPSARERQFLELPPEQSKSYEIGIKSSFADGRGRVNVAAYHQDFQNYPFRGPSVFYINYTRNATTGVVTGAPASFNFVAPVPVQVNGIEAEASYRVLDRWTLGVNTSYADGKIKNGTIACNDSNSDGVPDTNVATPTLAQLQVAVGPGQTISQCSGINQKSLNSPKFNANLQSELGFDVGASTDGFVRGLYTFAGKTSNDPDNTFDDIGALGLLNLYAGIRDKSGTWELTVFGKNVLNTHEVLNVGSGALSTTFRNQIGATQAPFVSQYRSVSVTAPREIGVNLRIVLGSN